MKPMKRPSEGIRSADMISGALVDDSGACHQALDGLPSPFGDRCRPIEFPERSCQSLRFLDSVEVEALSGEGAGDGAEKRDPAPGDLVIGPHGGYPCKLAASPPRASSQNGIGSARSKLRSTHGAGSCLLDLRSSMLSLETEVEARGRSCQKPGFRVGGFENERDVSWSPEAANTAVTETSRGGPVERSLLPTGPDSASEPSRSRRPRNVQHRLVQRRRRRRKLASDASRRAARLLPLTEGYDDLRFFLRMSRSMLDVHPVVAPCLARERPGIADDGAATEAASSRSFVGTDYTRYGRAIGGGRGNDSREKRGDHSGRAVGRRDRSGWGPICVRANARRTTKGLRFEDEEAVVQGQETGRPRGDALAEVCRHWMGAPDTMSSESWRSRLHGSAETGEEAATSDPHEARLADRQFASPPAGHSGSLSRDDYPTRPQQQRAWVAMARQRLGRNMDDLLDEARKQVFGVGVGVSCSLEMHGKGCDGTRSTTTEGAWANDEQAKSWRRYRSGCNDQDAPYSSRSPTRLIWGSVKGDATYEPEPRGRLVATWRSENIPVPRHPWAPEDSKVAGTPSHHGTDKRETLPNERRWSCRRRHGEQGQPSCRAPSRMGTRSTRRKPMLLSQSSTSESRPPIVRELLVRDVIRSHDGIIIPEFLRFRESSEDAATTSSVVLSLGTVRERYSAADGVTKAFECDHRYRLYCFVRIRIMTGATRIQESEVARISWRNQAPW